jgi:hypothetical protein
MLEGSQKINPGNFGHVNVKEQQVYLLAAQRIGSFQRTVELSGKLQEVYIRNVFFKAFAGKGFIVYDDAC